MSFFVLKTCLYHFDTVLKLTTSIDPLLDEFKIQTNPNAAGTRIQPLVQSPV